ncbi:MAG: chloride channel protein [Methylobacterium sp.]|nr:chloride channel protein [Methylobacterium sp.]
MPSLRRLRLPRLDFEASRLDARVPQALRRFVRRRELGLLMAGVLVGVVSGLVVAGLNEAAHALQTLLFDVPAGVDLSAAQSLSPWRTVLVPMLGGALVAALTLVVARRLGAKLADAIEANALYGGRLSLRGSLFIAGQTLVSNGCGGSVGLEAGFTQVCAALGSLLGRTLAARRSDMRLLVACGAAGAISAAFGAPLAGAFYAFEVVLGAYAAAGFVPVIASAVAATLVARRFTTHAYLLVPGFPTPLSTEMILQVGLVGALCALGAILLMLGVSAVERSLARIPALRPAFRPVLGGLLLGLLALVNPVVLGAGHGALQIYLVSNPTVFALAAAVALKMAGSALSLGSGFRGGLFFSSLLLGALLGQFYTGAAAALVPQGVIQPGTAAMAGMAAFGTGVLGAPVTMICLALETTGDFSITVGAVVAAAIASLIVRELFGYSFATWRFHLRGEDAIRGPHDVGWIRQISAAMLMRRDFKAVGADRPIQEVREGFTTGREKQAVLVREGRYAGVVLAADLNVAAGREGDPVGSVARLGDAVLLPGTPIRQVMRAFAEAETDVLAVIDPETRRVLGTVTEAHVLRKYGEELERRNEELVFG